MKVVIVMTYFERPYQLDVTLKSIAKTKHDDYEVIIVDDCSKGSINIKYDFPITVIRTKNKIWTNPEPAYNTGLYHAIKLDPDIIIIQNAECYHKGDVISYAVQNVTESNHIAFSCYSIDKETTFRDHDIDEVISKSNIGASRDGQNAWYNHPIYRPVAYDFCAAISTSNMLKLNGYDERLSLGCGRGDNYLLDRIKLMGLKIEIPLEPFVVHQWHYNTPVPENKAELVEKNRIIYGDLIKSKEIRAKHLFTSDLCGYC